MDYRFSYRAKNGSVCLILSYKDLSDSDRRKALWHEVRHINGGDLYEDSDVNALEAACHGGEEDFQIGEDMEIYVKDGE